MSTGYNGGMADQASRRIGGDNTAMDARTAAAYLGCAYQRYLEMRHIWGIHTYLDGRRVMTRRRELDAFIERGGSTATSRHDKKGAV